MTSRLPYDLVELTGILGQADRKNRLVLHFLEYLSTPGWTRTPDASYKQLFYVAPDAGGLVTPYLFRNGGRPDGAGIRGRCWVVPDYRGRGAKAKRARVLAQAADLNGEEVLVTARPKRYSFVDARGAKCSGTMLQLVALERLKSR